MGKVVLEIPQDIEVVFHFQNAKLAQEVVAYIKERVAAERVHQEIGLVNEKTPGIVPPRRNSLREDGDKVLGIWADRPESGQEIARQIRERNRKVT